MPDMYKDKLEKISKGYHWCEKCQDYTGKMQWTCGCCGTMYKCEVCGHMWHTGGNKNFNEGTGDW